MGHMISVCAARFYRSMQLLLVLCSLAIGPVAHSHDQEIEGGSDGTTATEGQSCVEGMSGIYPCFNIDLVHFLSLDTFDTSQVNDIWGWTDPLTGFEYVILGLESGTAFLHLEEDGRPNYLGLLPTRSFNSVWRDMKVYEDHVFVVSEAPLHGMQVFDLTRLRDVDPADAPVDFESDVDYVQFSKAHNIAINEETGYAYAVGTDTCARGLHMIDIRNPKQPVFVGCFSADGYTHDAQCVIYHGPDPDYFGREICFNSNEDSLTIVDVTDKQAPNLVARVSYLGQRYSHQGWLTEEHDYFLLGDELDELRTGVGTTTFVWDTSDLDAPFVAGTHLGESTAIDHNQYVRGNHVFQANYRSGIRVLRLGDLSEGEMSEVAFFDTVPADDFAQFSGTWSVYPFFESGYIVASDITQGLFILRPDLAAVPECSDGIDNDRDGLRDYPEDLTCLDENTASEDIRRDVEIKLQRRFAIRPIALQYHRWLDFAVLGSADVDVRNLELDSLLFHPGDVVPSARSRRRRTLTPDMNHDGWPDLALRVPLSDTTLAPGDESVCLTGLLAGDAFESCAKVSVVQYPWRKKSTSRRRQSTHGRRRR